MKIKRPALAFKEQSNNSDKSQADQHHSLQSVLLGCGERSMQERFTKELMSELNQERLVGIFQGVKWEKGISG